MIDNEGEKRTYLCPMCNIIFYSTSTERIKKHFIEHDKLSSILQKKIMEESYQNFLLYTANNTLQEREKMINNLKRTNKYHTILRELTKKKCLPVFVNEYQEELKKLLIEDKIEIKRKQNQERKKEKNSSLDIDLELKETESTNKADDKIYQKMKLIKRDNDDKQMVIKQKKKEIESLKQDNDSLYEQLKNTKKNLEIAIKTKDCLKTQLEEYRINSIEEYHKLKINYDSLMKQLEETQNKKIKIEDTIINQHSIISQLQKNIEKKEEIINKNKKVIKSLKQQIDEKNSKNLKEIQSLKDKYNDEKEILKKTIEKLQNELNNEKKEHNAAANKITVLQKQIENDKNWYEKEKQKHEKIINENYKTISNLHKKLKYKKCKQHRKNHKFDYTINNNVYSYHNSSFAQTNCNKCSIFQNNEEESYKRKHSFEDSLYSEKNNDYNKFNKDIIFLDNIQTSRFSSWIEAIKNRSTSKDKPYQSQLTNEKEDNNYGWNIEDNKNLSHWSDNSKKLDN